uniref:Secreted protein n=1 Tax=Macrostomum lignano TaxID=282301 RepID=A0A1I8G6Z1_9PLAT
AAPLLLRLLGLLPGDPPLRPLEVPGRVPGVVGQRLRLCGTPALPRGLPGAQQEMLLLLLPVAKGGGGFLVHSSSRRCRRVPCWPSGGLSQGALNAAVELVKETPQAVGGAGQVAEVRVARVGAVGQLAQQQQVAGQPLHRGEQEGREFESLAVRMPLEAQQEVAKFARPASQTANAAHGGAELGNVAAVQLQQPALVPLQELLDGLRQAALRQRRLALH